jgi:NAD(P)H-dependent flavin oxidoreductase YrpB (nitropropane dioxygenase family)
MGFFGHWMSTDLATFEAAAARLRVVEVYWTKPDAAIVKRARAAGPALVTWQVGSTEAALAAADAGCDFVVLQGIEAGGHVRGTVRRDELLASVLGRTTIPVVVGGGIATAAGVAAAIGAGAAAVRVGTRFVATAESGAHPLYIDALVAARSAEDTVLTTAFSDGWPDAPHRVLRSAVAAAEAYDGDIVGQVVAGDVRVAIPRFGAATPSRRVVGEIAAMALYAGEGVGDVTSVLPAGALVEELVSLLP